MTEQQNDVSNTSLKNQYIMTGHLPDVIYALTLKQVLTLITTYYNIGAYAYMTSAKHPLKIFWFIIGVISTPL